MYSSLLLLNQKRLFWKRCSLVTAATKGHLSLRNSVSMIYFHLSNIKNMKSNLLYLDKPELIATLATVVSLGNDENGSFVCLDKTVYYPGGGGQPKDSAVIEYQDKKTNITHANYSQKQLKHYIEDAIFQVGDEVAIRVDSNDRYLHSAYHSVGHLLASVICEQLFPEIKISRIGHFPGEAYISFILSENVDQNTDFINVINEELVKFNHSKVKVEHYLEEDKNSDKNLITYPFVRMVKVGDFLPVGCGGTHLKDFSNVTNIKIDRIKIKKGKLKAEYSCHYNQVVPAS